MDDQPFRPVAVAFQVLAAHKGCVAARHHHDPQRAQKKVGSRCLARPSSLAQKQMSPKAGKNQACNGLGDLTFPSDGESRRSRRNRLGKGGRMYRGILFNLSATGQSVACKCEP
jgi:hypothetical protein